mgnify:CR=1 FL=1
MQNFDMKNPALIQLAKEKIYENKDAAILSGILKPKGTVSNETTDSGPQSTTQTSSIQAIIDAEASSNPLNTV